MMPRRRGLVAALLLAGALGVAGCGADPAEPDLPGTPTAAEQPSAEPEPSEEPTPAPSGAPPTSVPDADLPGDAWDSGPTAGDELSVVGVAADDVLNVRTGPGVGFPVVEELEPLGSAEATGRGRLVDGGVWVEVTGAEATGWAYVRYLAYLGDVTDVTSELRGLGALPSGTDLADLARAVADLRSAGASGEVRPQVVVVDGPHLGDLGEVTVDVTGMADDSVLGVRLHVFAQPEGSTFFVRTVEQTVLCARGVDAGLCV
ncbi:hypothetical protein [Sanguibacter sp. 25GB23B1]|uniref:hypothetical protein n=1 Tax=unclassified Sanguibacter TaxID=2645534 RepID=UPI0032AF2ABF